MKVTEPFQTERDLLIRLDTKVEGLTSEVKDIKADIISRMAKAEARIDSLELVNAGFKANIKLIGFVITVLAATIGGVAATVVGKVFK